MVDGTNTSLFLHLENHRLLRALHYKKEGTFVLIIYMDVMLFKRIWGGFSLFCRSTQFLLLSKGFLAHFGHTKTWEILRKLLTYDHMLSCFLNLFSYNLTIPNTTEVQELHFKVEG